MAKRDPIISLQKALDLRGLEHMVHLMEERMLAQLHTYTDYKKNLESMCITFHRGYSRSRFKRCLDPVHADLFSSGPPVLEGGRTWIVVCKAVEYFKSYGRESLIREN